MTHNTMERPSRSYGYFDRIRRFLLILLLYLVFGIGAVAIALFMVLPVVILSRDQESRVRRVRWLNRQAFNGFTQSGIALGVFDVRFIDGELLNQSGQLIIANHPSLLDVVFLLGRIPNANCVVKKKLLRNPFLAIQVYFANYILNDEGEALLGQCIDRLESGESVIIFPEGTRTVKSHGYKFKRGAAHLMLNTDCTVRPVHISCDPAAMGKNDPWYYTPVRKISYRLAVLDKLDVTSIRQSNEVQMPFKTRRLTNWLTGMYHALDIGDSRQAYEGTVLSSILK